MRRTIPCPVFSVLAIHRPGSDYSTREMVGWQSSLKTPGRFTWYRQDPYFGPVEKKLNLNPDSASEAHFPIGIVAMLTVVEPRAWSMIGDSLQVIHRVMTGLPKTPRPLNFSIQFRVAVEPGNLSVALLTIRLLEWEEIDVLPRCDSIYLPVSTDEAAIRQALFTRP